MKLLKIEDNMGYWLNSDDKYIPVDKITKEDLMKLVGLVLDTDVELDEYSEENIKNQAHQIIYKSIFQKLRDLRDRKQEFIDESKRLYLHDYQKYRDESIKKPDGAEKK